VSGTFDALKRAERDREQAESARAGALEQLSQDISALRVTVHALEDRIELELGGLQDEMRQAIAKVGDLAANRSRAAEDRVVAQFGWLTQESQRSGRRLDVLTALAGLAATVLLFRC
jgi:hypothetical protein